MLGRRGIRMAARITTRSFRAQAHHSKLIHTRGHVGWRYRYVPIDRVTVRHREAVMTQMRWRTSRILRRRIHHYLRMVCSWRYRLFDEGDFFGLKIKSSIRDAIFPTYCVLLGIVPLPRFRYTVKFYRWNLLDSSRRYLGVLCRQRIGTVE